MIESKMGNKTSEHVYLICDLDGTLLKNDFFVQVFVKSLFSRPIYTLKCFSKGLVYLKKSLLDDYNPDIKEVINENTVSLLKKESGNFKQLLLISASTDAFVKRIGAQFELFDACHGSTNVNLKGEKKLQFILDKGYTPFVYIGDSKADTVLFDAAEYYYIVKNDIPVLVK